ncbi:hypothetical protein EV128_12063 [Rhizobium azibense]|nr:hypothetical protein EV128_12063 [Rhizobium azibense]
MSFKEKSKGDLLTTLGAVGSRYFVYRRGESFERASCATGTTHIEWPPPTSTPVAGNTRAIDRRLLSMRQQDLPEYDGIVVDRVVRSVSKCDGTFQRQVVQSIDVRMLPDSRGISAVKFLPTGSVVTRTISAIECLAPFPWPNSQLPHWSSSPPGHKAVLADGFLNETSGNKIARNNLLNSFA